MAGPAANDPIADIDLRYHTRQMLAPWGRDWERELNASPYRLRFELAQGSSHLNRFIGAFDRARALARSALSTDDLIGVIAANPDPRSELGAKWRGWTKGTALEHLEEMGVPADSALSTWTGYFWPDDRLDDEAEPWSHCAIPLTWDQADILLWNQVAHDMGVTPQAPVVSKLVNPKRGVSVHAYDDRGMDITSVDKELIAGLYGQFDGWLLDFDRDRMAAAFEN